ncbi:unnamed protein product [Discosporangium mesarthrocarpum]
MGVSENPSSLLTMGPKSDVGMGKYNHNPTRDGEPVTSAGSTIFALKAPDIFCCKDMSGGRRLRVVCISDTHGKHNEMRHTIPDGDILIHCGDFSTRMLERDFEDATANFNSFLGSLGHKHKV